MDPVLVNPSPSNRYEAALRGLPDAYSLALRLSDADVPREVICQYLDIEPEGLDVLITVANQKLAAELDKADGL